MYMDTSEFPRVLFVNLLWGAFILCALLTEFIPQLRNIANHGKRNVQKQPQDVFSRMHAIMQIPKSFFTHMYILGAIVASVVLFSLLSHPTLHPEQMKMKIAMTLWTIHVMRRLFESVFLTIYGNSKMHVGGYLAGMCHYCKLVHAICNFLTVNSVTQVASLSP